MRKQMKSKLWIVILLLASGTLAGCGVAYPELAPEEQSQIAEYTAGLILKYDQKYESNLLSPEELEKALAERAEKVLREIEKAEREAELLAQKQAAEDAAGESVSATEEVEEVPPMTLTEVMAMDGIDFQYTGYEILDAYPAEVTPGEVAFVVSATAGNRLLVMKFDVSNQAGSNYYLNMPEKGANYRVAWNGENSRNTMITMLLDDMTYYVGEIAAGQAVPLVLVGEIPTESADGVGSLELTVRDAEGSHRVLLF